MGHRPNNRGSPRSGRHGAGRQEKGAWLYGTHAVLAALKNPDRVCKEFLATANAARHLPAGTPLSPRIVEGEALSRQLPKDAVHQGLALLVEPISPPSIEAACTPRPGEVNIAVVLDQVSDPHNVGAILRSAAAFGARAVIVTERHAPSAGGVLAKSASGALEHVPLIAVVNLARALEMLAKLGYWRIGLAADAKRSIAEIEPGQNIALVLGAEGEGLRRLTREHCDELVRIPARGAIGSLNVSNAAAIALFQISG